VLLISAGVVFLGRPLDGVDHQAGVGCVRHHLVEEEEEEEEEEDDGG
jgi:hypothetical protein